MVFGIHTLKVTTTGRIIVRDNVGVTATDTTGTYNNDLKREFVCDPMTQ